MKTVERIREWAKEKIDKVKDPSYGQSYGYVVALESLLEYLDENGGQG